MQSPRATPQPSTARNDTLVSAAVLALQHLTYLVNAGEAEGGLDQGRVGGEPIRDGGQRSEERKPPHGKRLGYKKTRSEVTFVDIKIIFSTNLPLAL